MENQARFDEQASDSERLFLACVHEYPPEWHPSAFDRRIPNRQKKRYRYDFIWDAERVLIEIQGGLYMAKSGHNTGKGITRDINKVNLATLEGYKIFQCPGQIKIREMRAFVGMVLGMIAQIRGTHPPKRLPKQTPNKTPKTQSQHRIAPFQADPEILALKHKIW